MNTILEALRQILGQADFCTVVAETGEIVLNYNSLMEYFFGAVILCIVVSSIFKFLYRLVG